MQDTASSYLKTFSGLRFLLYGFDPSDQQQVRSMLFSGGGVEAQDFTHLVVDNTIYDDPVCVSARNDGKTVVTKLWVDHSFEIGLVVDSTSVMYQPPKDLNGIPGADKIFICLTGYQRQDREDIMTMVSLMGAQFSKALVASKITHLICYKFEGEKYELARRVPKIKIVNHRWLEDCLRNWKLLPEDQYSKSGCEMESLEAEVRDSEDEVSDDTSLKRPSSRIVNQSLQITRNASPKNCDLSISTSEVPTTPAGPDGFLTVHNDKEVLLTPVTKKRMDTTSRLTGPSERTSGSAEAGYKIDSVCTSAEKLPHSIMESSVISFYRKTPQTSKDLGCSPKVQIGEPINVSSVRVEDAKGRSGSNSEIFERLVSEQVSEGEKQRADVWKSNPQKRNRQPSVTGGSPISSRAQGLNSPSLPSTSDILPDGDHVHSGNGIVSRNAMLSPTSNSSKEVPVTSREKSIVQELQFGEATTLGRTEHQSPDMRLQTSLGGLKELNSPTKHNSGNLGLDRSKLADDRNYEREASLVSKAHLESERIPALATSDSNQRQDDKSVPSKQVRKDTATRKTLGSRLKLKSAVNRKGPIYLKEVAAAKEDLATDPRTGNDADDETKSSRDEEIGKAVADVAPVEHVERELMVEADDLQDSTGFMDDETEPPLQTYDQSDVLVKKIETVGLEATEKEPEGHHMEKNCAVSEVDLVTEDPQQSDKSIADGDGDARKKSISQRLPSSERKRKTVLTVNENSSNSTKAIAREEQQAAGDITERNLPASCRPSIKKKSRKRRQGTVEADKDNEAIAEVYTSGSLAGKHVESCKTTVNGVDQVAPEGELTSVEVGEISTHVEREPMFFLFSGHSRPQRKEFQKAIKRLKGKCCRDFHHWSYQATHLIVADPLRRTEKIFAAAASGRWILKTDYLLACSTEGRWLPEEPYEWHKKGVSEDGAINLVSPRKWRLLREKTGHGAFYGMRIVIYGDCIAPPLDTLKRVVKAGDGTILATSPPYTRFLTSGVDYAIVTPGTSIVDERVQEFLRHEIPCVAADYLVDYVCRTGYSLDEHVLFNTQKWADRSFSNLARKAEEIVIVGEEPAASSPKACSSDDAACQVCGGCDRGEVMLLCGDQSGNVGCGLGWHIDCCDPPLDSIPEEDWLCPNCSTADVNPIPTKGGKKRRKRTTT